MYLITMLLGTSFIFKYYKINNTYIHTYLSSNQINNGNYVLVTPNGQMGMDRYGQMGTTEI